MEKYLSDIYNYRKVDLLTISRNLLNFNKYYSKDRNRL